MKFPRLLLTILLLLSTTAFAKTQYKNMVVFGDSLSDNGNLYAMTYHQKNGPIPSPKNWYNGRFSNGIVLPEYLAPMLNISTTNFLDFAYGGAQTGFGNVENAAAPKGIKYPGLLNEISLFLHDKIRFKPNSTLYIIWVGADNYLDNKNKNLAGQIKQVSVETAEAISLLTSRADAQHFMVINMPDLGKTPRAREAGKEDPKIPTELSALTKANNKALAKTLDNLKKKLGVDITYVDINQIFNATLNQPKQFGLTNTTQPCFNAKTKTTCNNPNQYLFWGTIHPTTRTHQILAEFIYHHYLQ